MQERCLAMQGLKALKITANAQTFPRIEYDDFYTSAERPGTVHIAIAVSRQKLASVTANPRRDIGEKGKECAGGEHHVHASWEAPPRAPRAAPPRPRGWKPPRGPPCPPMPPRPRGAPPRANPPRPPNCSGRGRRSSTLSSMPLTLCGLAAMAAW
jgi:hypothetical protein